MQRARALEDAELRCKQDLPLQIQESLEEKRVLHFQEMLHASAYPDKAIGEEILRNFPLTNAPRHAWLCVDDLLLLLTKARLKEDLAVVVALLAVLGVLISWRKAQLSP